MSVVPRLRNIRLGASNKFLDLELYKYLNGLTSPGLVWGEESTWLRVQNLRVPWTLEFQISDILKNQNQCKKIPYEQQIKILSKDNINRDGVWVEEVKILFILMTKVWDISTLPPL